MESLYTPRALNTIAVVQCSLSPRGMLCLLLQHAGSALHFVTAAPLQHIHAFLLYPCEPAWLLSQGLSYALPPFQQHVYSVCLRPQHWQPQQWPPLFQTLSFMVHSRLLSSCILLSVVCTYKGCEPQEAMLSKKVVVASVGSTCLLQICCPLCMESDWPCWLSWCSMQFREGLGNK